MTDHAGRVALVTGATSGIGLAVTRTLARDGFRVFICARDGAGVAATVKALVADGHEVDGTACDVRDGTQIEAFVGAAVQRYGPVGVLVNNASVFERDEWDDASRESWDRHVEPNLRAPFALTQQFARALPAGAEGAVVNVLDQRVWSPTPHFLSYTLSKAGLWSLTQQFALALAPRVRVNGIGPGPALPSPRQSAEQFARQCASVPLGRGTSPEEVARAVLCILALPAMTGQMVALDGGQHLQWSPASASGAPPE